MAENELHGKSLLIFIEITLLNILLNWRWMHLTILNSLLNLGKNSKQRFKKIAHNSLPKGIPMTYVLLRKSYSQSHLPCTRNFATEKIGLRFYTDPLPLHKDFQPHPQDVLSFLMSGIKMFLGHGFALYGCPQTLVSWLSLRISTSSFCHEVKRKLTNAEHIA